jgi:hypothetical protein
LVCSRWITCPPIALIDGSETNADCSSIITSSIVSNDRYRPLL